MLCERRAIHNSEGWAEAKSFFGPSLKKLAADHYFSLTLQYGGSIKALSFTLTEVY